MLFYGKFLSGLSNSDLLIKVKSILANEKYLVLEVLIVVLRVFQLVLLELIQALSSLLRIHLLHGKIHPFIAYLCGLSSLHLSECLLYIPFNYCLIRDKNALGHHFRPFLFLFLHCLARLLRGGPLFLLFLFPLLRLLLLNLGELRIEEGEDVVFAELLCHLIYY